MNFIVNLRRLPSSENRLSTGGGQLAVYSLISTPDLCATRFPSNTVRCINVGLAFVERRRRWTNVKPTSILCLVSAE